MLRELRARHGRLPSQPLLHTKLSPLRRLTLMRTRFSLRALPSGLIYQSLGVASYRHYSIARPAIGGCTAVLRQSWARNSMRPWMCAREGCRAVNRGSSPACETCGEAKPKMRGWKCVACGTCNHSGVKLCKECKEPFQRSKDFWMCAACKENNRVDEWEDNSRCGFCGYDMAPLTKTEEEMLRAARERSDALQQQQQHFDAVSSDEAERQWGNPLAGAEALPEELRRPVGTAAHPSKTGSASSRPLEIGKVEPYVPRPAERAHSKLFRRSQPNSASAVPAGPPGFDWMCRTSACAQVNPGDEEVCLKCGAHILPEDWECPCCAALNHLSRARCFNCDAPIPISWTCGACGVATSIYDKTCRECGAARPAVEPQHVSPARGGGGGPLASARQPRLKEDWYCTACDALNFSRRTECFQCGSPRAGGARSLDKDTRQSAPRSTGNEVGHNNWLCRYCNSSNFRTRKSCWQCGRPAQAGIGGWSSDSSAPHYSREGFQDAPEDKPAEGQMNSWKKTDEWTCAKCFSRNFRNRSDCFKCGAPKQLAVAPRRAAVRKPVKL